MEPVTHGENGSTGASVELPVEHFHTMHLGVRLRRSSLAPALLRMTNVLKLPATMDGFRWRRESDLRTASFNDQQSRRIYPETCIARKNEYLRDMGASR